MTPEDESRTDVAWREIIENYGARVVLEAEESLPSAELEPDAEPERERDSDPAPEPSHAVTPDEHFRPPAPPPVALPSTWQRRVAWVGVFGAPALGLLLAFFHVIVAPLISWALVAWFVGGFGYLVATMSNEPRDPWDNGSRV